MDSQTVQRARFCPRCPTQRGTRRPGWSPSTGPGGFIDAAAGAAGQADMILAELQDSMLPVEVGDQELRAGLAEVRELLDGLWRRARELKRTLGR